jgi:PBP1b-binding outer membrane lipoprotein LpoB
MTWITRSSQRSVWLLLLILVLSLMLVACGQRVNATSSNASNNNAASQQLQPQPNQPVQPQSGNSSATTTGAPNLQNTDQQVQSIMNQLDGARNDVNNSDAASSQDNGQQP